MRASHSIGGLSKRLSSHEKLQLLNGSSNRPVQDHQPYQQEPVLYRNLYASSIPQNGLESGSLLGAISTSCQAAP